MLEVYKPHAIVKALRKALHTSFKPPRHHLGLPSVIYASQASFSIPRRHLRPQASFRRPRNHLGLPGIIYVPDVIYASQVSFRLPRRHLLLPGAIYASQASFKRSRPSFYVLCVFPVYSLHGNACIYTCMRAKRMGCPNDGLGHLNDAWGGGCKFQ